MIKDIEKEFNLVKEGFLKVKEDNLYLLEKIDALEKANKGLVIMVKNSIGRVGNLPDNDKMFVGNLISKKVHYFDCGFAKKINEDNRQYFSNSEQAVEEGFSLCQCIDLD